MEVKKSIKNRRIGVILTFLSLFGIVLFFEYFKLTQTTNIFITLIIILLIIFIVSFTLTFIKTELWNFIHKPIKKLDEREIVLTGKSLRYAYGIFTVAVLGFLLLLAIISIPIDIVLVTSLILFAHILPAAIIAWTEKEIHL